MFVTVYALALKFLSCIGYWIALEKQLPNNFLFPGSSTSLEAEILFPKPYVGWLIFVGYLDHIINGRGFWCFELFNDGFGQLLKAPCVP